jgi:hypothetical protein
MCAAAMLVPSFALADENENADAVRVRFYTDASADEISRAACTLTAAFESSGRGVGFDVSVDDHRCSSEPIEQDAIALRVRTAERHVVVLESASDTIPRTDLERGVSRVGRDLKQKLVRVIVLPAPREEAEVVDPRAWKEGDSVPSGYHTESHARYGMLGAGAGMFGAAYIFSAIGGAAAGGGPFGWLFVPVAGPFVMATEAFVLAPLTLGLSAIAGFLFMVDGVAQTVGLALTIYGAASQKTVLVRNESSAFQIKPVPFATRDSAGLAFVGRF